jgi:Ca-activated chloride channel family protein
MKEFSQTLYAVADDVYMNVEFNPDYVKEYRLIGFDNKVGALKDSLSAIEGGEVGSGQSMMAVFEIVPDKKAAGEAGAYADIKLQYRKPGKAQMDNFRYTSPAAITDFSSIDSAYRFSTAVVMFGSILRQSVVAKNINWNDIIALATQSIQKDNLMQKEFVALVQLAKVIYAKQKRKKKETDEGH